MNQQTTMEPIDFEAMDRRFIKNLLSCVHANEDGIHTLKNVWGKRAMNYCALFIMLGGIDFQVVKEKETYFFIESLLFSIETKRNSKPDGTYISIPELIGRYYGHSPSENSRKKIIALMGMKYDKHNIFEQKLKSLILSNGVKELKAGENVDYVALLRDLKFWNKKTRDVQLRWSNKIAKAARLLEED